MLNRLNKISEQELTNAFFMENSAVIQGKCDYILIRVWVGFFELLFGERESFLLLLNMLKCFFGFHCIIVKFTSRHYFGELF